MILVQYKQSYLVLTSLCSNIDFVFSVNIFFLFLCRISRGLHHNTHGANVKCQLLNASVC